MCLDLAEVRFCIFAEDTYVTPRRICTVRNLLKTAEVSPRRICTVRSLLKTTRVTDSRRVRTVGNLLKTDSVGDVEKLGFVL